MMTEAYASLANTIKYYTYGSHVPFNFNFITNVNKDSDAATFKETIDEWMKAMPADGVANWVVREHSNHMLICFCLMTKSSKTDNRVIRP